MQELGPNVVEIFKGAGTWGLVFFIVFVFILYAYKPTVEAWKVIRLKQVSDLSEQMENQRLSFEDQLKAQKLQFDVALQGKEEQMEYLKLQVVEIKAELEDMRNRYFLLIDRKR